MTSNLDISILQKPPQLEGSVVLEIQPLAPLSMVSELPGSYYKTLKMPDKKMLCGLFENILGWHIDLADRKEIAKEVKKLREKWVKQQEKQKNTLFEADRTVIPYTDYTKGSTYLPLLMDYFEIENLVPIISTKVMFYDDLWKKAYRRADSADVHIGGSSNLSYEALIIHTLSNDDRKEYFKNHLGLFPLFYSTPTEREYISMDGKYELNLSIDCELYRLLKEKSITNNIGCLGSSEGWVDLKIKEL